MAGLAGSVLAGLAPLPSAARRVIIVGGGIGGLSLAWALARQGQTVTVLEAGTLPNPSGSSFDDGRIIRHVYGTLAGYAAMMPAAYQAWGALFADTGSCRLAPRQALYVLRDEGPWEEAAGRTLAAAGLPMQVLDDDALKAAPMLRRDGVRRVVSVGGSGILAARAILQDLLRLLPTRGVVIRSGMAAVEVDCETGRVTLAGGESLSADVVVVAAGVRASALLPGAARDAGLRASVQTLAYLDPPDRLAAAWRAGPMLLCRLPGHPAGGVYVLPPADGALLKMGDYDTTTDADPSHDHAALRVDRAMALLDAGAQALAGFGAYRLIRFRHCAYTMAPDDRFVVTRAGVRGWLLSACSGHGFKLAPLIALGLAEAIAERIDPATITRWAAGRDGEDGDA